MGQLKKGFYPDAFGRESCFLQLCGKRKSILISYPCACKCKVGNLLSSDSNCHSVEHSKKGTTLLGKNGSESCFFENNPMRNFGKAGGICQTGNQPDRAI